MVSYVHDGDGTIGHELTINMVNGSSNIERTFYARIAHIDTKAFEQEGEGKSSLIDRGLRRRSSTQKATPS